MTTTRPPPDLGGCRCVVLGAGGFIGTNLIRALVERGADVLGFGHRPRFPAAVRAVPWVDGSFDDPAAIGRALDDREVVYHLLGSSVPAASNLDPSTELLASAANTLSLLDRCKERKIRRIVFASSGGTVYGAAGRLPTPETVLPAPISAYGVGKLVTEGYQSLYERLYGIQQIALRIANPYGPYQSEVHSQGIVAAALGRALRGEPLEIWGDGEVVRDFVYIDDVCDAFVRATGYAGPHRVFNVGSGEGRSINAVLADLDRIVRPHRVHATHRPARPVDVPVSVLDIARIRQELGWSPRTTWDAGLAQTLAWMVAFTAVGSGA
jgi:UDP-glucose 4-epimerase